MGFPFSWKRNAENLAEYFDQLKQEDKKIKQARECDLTAANFHFSVSYLKG